MSVIKLISVNFLIILAHLIVTGNGQRAKDKMYTKITGFDTCFRRLNATHQIGCSSTRDGSSGVIHFCDTQNDLNFILENGTAGPYIPVIPTKLFTKANVDSCNGKVNGIVLYKEKEKPSYFTHENQCPNPQSSLTNTCGESSTIWNPYGTGLIYHDIPYPVFYINEDEEIKIIRECFKKHNNFSYETQRDRSLCSLELTSFMYATTDTPTCVRRSNSITNFNPVKFCDPLGDLNVWSTLFPLVENNNFSKPIRDFKYIILTAKLDTTSLFYVTAGAITPVTGLVTLLATAKLLKNLLPQNDGFDTNVLFLLFNGESYDYIGSQRVLYDMLRGKFPLKSDQYLPKIQVDDVRLFIELNQLSDTGSVVAHYSKDKKEIKEFLLTLNSNKNDINLDERPGSLPPASLHTFLKNQTEFPGVILTDHISSYANHYYNSIYDNITNINYKYYNKSNGELIPNNTIQKFIGNVSEMLAQSIFEVITNKSYNGNENNADIYLINELIYCYLENSNCNVHNAVQKLKLQNSPFNLYVGVGGVNTNFITSLIGLTLGWLTGDVTGPGNINCTNTPKNYAFKYYNMSKSLDDLNTTLCYRITMNFTEAVSPAFLIEDYDWSSGLYSSWSESIWSEMKMRMFLKPSNAHENMTIAIGSMVLIFSFLVVYFIKSRSDILFTSTVPTLAPTNC